jgi:Ni/Co efflux regulator RcnB
MKKLMLVAVCAAFIGVGTASAQDTTKTKQTPTQQPSNQLKDDMKGWTMVTAAEVPESLRTTLANNQYKGWESGTVYKNQAGDTYAVQIGAGTEKKVHYFDKNGKVTKRPNDRGN